VPFPVAAQRIALRANAARGVISHGERQNERWVAPLCAAGQGAIMASIAASGATAAASNALRRLRALDRRDLSRRDERFHRRMQRHHDLIR
jgi:hypothetical protein